MAKDFSHALGFLYGQPWAILPEKFTEIEAVLWHRIRTGEGREYHPPEPRSVRAEVDAQRGYALVGSAGVVPIIGTISPRPSIFSEYSGGVSTEQIVHGVRKAAEDKSVAAIILDIDSPGGSVHGLAEAAEAIFAARKTKPVIAVANHMAASAAYYLASQASELVVPSDGWVGSVGTIWPRLDASKADEMAGLKTHLMRASGSPFKAEGDPSLPMSDAEREDRQKMLDGLYEDFVNHVARGRGVTPKLVKTSFGEGRMRFAPEALRYRMVDRIDTLASVLGRYPRTGSTTRQTRSMSAAAIQSRVKASLVKHGLPIAKAPALPRSPAPSPAPLPTRTPADWETRVHESAHALLGWKMGFTITGVYATTSDARVQYAALDNSVATAAVAVAGIVAEGLLCGVRSQWSDHYSTADMKLYRESVVFPVDEEFALSLATKTINQNRKQILALAEELKTKPIMTGAEAVAILSR